MSKHNGPYAKTPEQLFWSHVTPISPNECWEWNGPRLKNGYGQMYVKVNGKWKNTMTHRLSWEIHYGEIPSGKVIMHKCDNPACVNPNHLSVGTHLDNIIDKVRKGRQRHRAHIGTEHGMSKLNDANVKWIYQEYAKGVTIASMARALNVSESAIRNVIKGRSWKHVR